MNRMKPMKGNSKAISHRDAKIAEGKYQGSSSHHEGHEEHEERQDQRVWFYPS
jgi:hypothetical protein